MSQARSPWSTFCSRLAVSWFAAGLLLLGSSAAFSDPVCRAAAIWTSPQEVNYRNVLRDVEEHGSQPNFTVFIEPPDGSAADIDPNSVRLNGLPALPHPSSVGDANGNGVPDLMVKFNRGALITSTGLVTVTGRTTSDGCITGDAGVAIRCLPVDVQRFDDWIVFTTSNMPDPSLDNQQAQLEVHRVEPVFPAGCPNISPIRAVVLVHGLSVPAAAAFDLQYEDYSLMETLARRGIETFAANHLGFGRSAIVSGPNPLDEPCNASLPLCQSSPCAPNPGVCDCAPGLPPNYKRDQQGSADYLRPNPLHDRCAHTSSIHFQVVTDQVRQLALVVDYALAKTGREKVHLLGSSLGGPTVGKYLGDDPSHQRKVAGAIFLASSFRGAGVPTSTWPLGLINRADAMSNFNLAGPSCVAGDGCASGCPVPDPDCARGLTGCPGQKDPAIDDPFWTAIKGSDPVGPGWGTPDGLSRYPVVPRFNWNEDVAARIEVPALVINGLKDTVVRVAASTELWSASPPQGSGVACAGDADCASEYACRPFPSPARCRLKNRTLVQLDCASHALMWETCSGEGCVDPHRTVQKLVGDWILTGQ
jgi:pimeloyl-ACP methyl ester carboxylesterase